MKKILLIIIIGVVAIVGYRAFAKAGVEVKENIVEEVIDANGPTISFKDSVIKLGHTDENVGEDLIIHSDKKTYAGFSQSDVYFSVANPGDFQQAVDLQFLFPHDGGTVTSVQEVDPALAPNYSSNDERTAPWKNMTLARTGIPMTPALQLSVAKKKPIPDDFASDGRIKFAIAPRQTLYFKARIAFDPGDEGEFWIEGFGDKGSYGLLDPWYNSSWLYRRPITIGKNMVGGGANLTNFPVLVQVSHPDLRVTGSGGRVNGSAGEDILFTDSDGSTLLDYEIEKYTSTTGALTAWVEVPTLSYTANTTIYVYYGGTAVSNADPGGIWNDNQFAGVWHLGDTASPVLDSTTNDNDGTESGTITYSSTGKINESVVTNNTDDFFSIAENGTLDQTTLFTFTGWVKANSFGTGDYIATKFRLSNGTSWAVGVNSLFVPRMIVSDTATDGVLYTQGLATTVLSTGRWYHLAIVYDGGGATDSDKIKIYLNGVQETVTFPDGNPVPAALVPVDQPVLLGEIGGVADREWDGHLDEIRISAAKRTAGWAGTEYNNQYNPTHYVILGPQQVETHPEAGVRVKGGTRIKGGVRFR